MKVAQKEEQVLPANRKLVSLPILPSRKHSIALAYCPFTVILSHAISLPLPVPPSALRGPSLVPANDIPILLRIMITLSVHHHPFHRREQPVAVC